MPKTLDFNLHTNSSWLGLLRKHGNTLLDSTMGFPEPIWEREDEFAPKKGHFSWQIVPSQIQLLLQGPHWKRLPLIHSLWSPYPPKVWIRAILLGTQSQASSHSWLHTWFINFFNSFLCSCTCFGALVESNFITNGIIQNFILNYKHFLRLSFYWIYFFVLCKTANPLPPPPHEFGSME